MRQLQNSFDHTAFVSQVLVSMGRISFPVRSTVATFKTLAPKRCVFANR